MTIFEESVAAVLLIWLIVSVLRQFPGRLSARIDAIDICHIVPIWIFFAPRPAGSDLHILFRDYHASGLVSPWKEIPTTFANHPLRMLWNPRKRVAKAVFDMAQILMELRDQSPAVTRLSVAYLALLNFVCSQPHASSVQAREFLIVETLGYLPREPLRLAFRSDIHALA